VSAILSTGYSDVLTDEEALQIGIKKYLIKPIKLAVLEQCIEDCFK
jgi:response regulator of citrate/malate metabolism